MTVRALTFRRAGLCLVLLSMVLASGPLAAQPPAITGLYDEIRIAIELEDVDAVISRFAPLLRIETSLGQSWLSELSAMFNQQESIAAELEFDNVEVVGQRAFVLATWAFSGTTTDTGEVWSKTVQRADVLVQQGGVWEVYSTEGIDQEALRTKVTENQFLDPDNGLEVTAPRDWRLYAITGMKTAATAYSPDLTTSIAWIAMDLPGTFTAEHLGQAHRDGLEKLGPALGISFRDVTSGPDTLAGREAYRLRRTVIAGDGSETYSDLTFCVTGSTLYLCARAATPPSAYASYAEAIDRSVAATKIVEVQSAELPPEAGRVEGRKYINDVYGCEIIGPEGWDIRVGQGQFKLQVTMTEPGGKSNITLGMVEVPAGGGEEGGLGDEPLTPEKAVLSDDNLTSTVFDGFEVVERGETTVGELPAYQSITKFDLGGEKRQRQRVYLVDNDRLFFMFADAAPADRWERLAPLFTETLQSFKLIEAQPLP